MRKISVVAAADPGAKAATWTSASIAPGKSISLMSCRTPTFCLAVASDQEGGGPLRIFTSTNPAGGAGAWVAARARLSIGAITCPSISLCVVGGAGEITVSTNPTAGAKSVWKLTARWPALSTTDITGLACPRKSFCVGVDIAGDVYSSANPAVLTVFRAR